MQRMKEGDKWEIYIPAELGYGDEGTPGGKVDPIVRIFSNKCANTCEQSEALFPPVQRWFSKSSCALSQDDNIVCLKNGEGSLKTSFLEVAQDQWMICELKLADSKKRDACARGKSDRLANCLSLGVTILIIINLYHSFWQSALRSP